MEEDDLSDFEVLEGKRDSFKIKVLLLSGNGTMMITGSEYRLGFGGLPPIPVPELKLLFFIAKAIFSSSD